ncbi:MAG: hypothetical protein LH618_02410 [Saprospiraceae bacterium]|nr:hypothetical protein [Saprospiraceae bacterium]
MSRFLPFAEHLAYATVWILLAAEMLAVFVCRRLNPPVLLRRLNPPVLPLIGG